MYKQKGQVQKGRTRKNKYQLLLAMPKSYPAFLSNADSDSEDLRRGFLTSSGDMLLIPGMLSKNQEEHYSSVWEGSNRHHNTCTAHLPPIFPSCSLLWERTLFLCHIISLVAFLIPYYVCYLIYWPGFWTKNKLNVLKPPFPLTLFPN